MSKARQLIERMTAPVEAPPKPGTKPATDPKPAQPARRPSPWRRKDIKPGQEPRPKACAPGGMGRAGGPY